MHPVMQQTNVIHVAQGGTVIFPGSQHGNTQINHQNPAQVQTSMSQMNFVQNQQLSQQIGMQQRQQVVSQGQNYYQIVQPQQQQYYQQQGSF
jgi:hypothetical protein